MIVSTTDHVNNFCNCILYFWNSFFAFLERYQQRDPTGLLDDPKTLRYRQGDPTGLLDDPKMLRYRQGDPTGLLDDPKTLRYRQGDPTDLR